MDRRKLLKNLYLAYATAAKGKEKSKAYHKLYKALNKKRKKKGKRGRPKNPIIKFRIRRYRYPKKLKNRADYKKNREEILEKRKNYYEENRARILLRTKLYKQKNKEKIRKTKQKWDQDNRAKLRKYRRKQYMKENVTLEQIKEFLEQKKGQRILKKKERTDLESQLNQLRRKEKNILEAQLTCQIVAKKTQNEIKLHISPLISMAEATIYDDPYEFEFNFVTKRGKTEAEPKFIRDGKYYIPGKETGLGPVDIASLGTRLSLWCLNKQTINNTLLLDEPFKHLDEKALSRTSNLLKMMSKELNIQFIIIVCNIEHNAKLIETADKLYEMKK